MNAISEEQALSICEQIQAKNRGKWFTYQAWWCWGCITFTKGDLKKRCFANNHLDNRGCLQVNEHFDQVHSAE